ncbi:MAG: putative toxin-antitoxin system toxin component, PIN family, partial [Burkholderiales bacterium]
VFDTNVVLSALRFSSGRLAWLRGHWASRAVEPLASQQTIAELISVLAYLKFKLSSSDVQDLLSEYLPYATLIKKVPRAPLRCRDPKDQMFVDLSTAAKADVLVSGDRDLLALNGDGFIVETPEQYARRWFTSAAG